MIKATRSSVTRLAAAIGLALGLAGAAQAQAQKLVGTTFPRGFQTPIDNSLFNSDGSNKLLIGFGDRGKVRRTPVIFVHDNSASPYPIQGCTKSLAHMQAMAQHFANNAYSTSELWALGYLGNPCDATGTLVKGADGMLVAQGADVQTDDSHTHRENVPDLRAFVNEVLRYTGAKQVDIVAHGMGVTLVREWARQDDLRKNPVVRRFVAIDGPNQGTLMCASIPASQTGAYQPFVWPAGYTPTSPLCTEIGSPSSAFLQTLNSPPPAIDPKVTLVIRNGDSSYAYMTGWDGNFMGVSHSYDSQGVWTDFSGSARIKLAAEATVTGAWSSVTDAAALTLRAANSHDGIAMSPQTWSFAYDFLTKP